MRTRLTTDFLWYVLAAIVASIAVVSDYLNISGAISGPMLWTLFGVATNRIMTHREIRNIQQNMNTLPCNSHAKIQANIFPIQPQKKEPKE